MTTVPRRAALFRARDAKDVARVTNIELFFDLVFVFAVTQLSQRLLADLTPLGSLQTLLLFLAVWWLWMYTSWATNWLDPERSPVRALLIVMMLGSLILAGALPRAFANEGMMFAIAYCTMQVGRTLAIVWASCGVNRARVRNFMRIAFYFLLSTPFWIGGALAEGTMRIALWAAALTIEYAGPFLFFRAPGLGPSRAADWDISGAHMAERSALFIIIALGEAILITGASYAALPQDVPTTAAFVASFIGSAAMWWVYFDTGAKRGSEVMEESRDAGRLARNAYTYLHMPIVAGIIITAVGDELTMAHPLGHAAGPALVLTACGGPLAFLVGNQGFKWLIARRPSPPLSHLIGELLLLAVGLAAWLRGWTPLTTTMLATAALIVTATWEWFSLNGGWRHWAPWIGDRTAIALEDGER